MKQLAFPHSALQDEQNEGSHYRVSTTGSKVEMSLVHLKTGLAWQGLILVMMDDDVVIDDDDDNNNNYYYYNYY